jgi:MFS family permease
MLTLTFPTSKGAVSGKATTCLLALAIYSCNTPLTISHYCISKLITLHCAVLLQTTVVRVDKVGRRSLLLAGSAVSALSLAVLGASFLSLHHHSHNSSSSSSSSSSDSGWSSRAAVALVAACGLVGAYAASYGPVVWLCTAEMFPSSLRGRALGFTQVRDSLSYIS